MNFNKFTVRSDLQGLPNCLFFFRGNEIYFVYNFKTNTLFYSGKGKGKFYEKHSIYQIQSIFSKFLKIPRATKYTLTRDHWVLIEEHFKKMNVLDTFF